MPAYHVERSIVIQATPLRVFETVADFSTWTTWSPWLIAEPEATVTVSPDSSSVGSTYAWKGDITGQGQLEHKRLELGRLVEDELVFLKPFKSTCSSTFKLEASGEGTRLTWTMDGSMPFFMFWMIPMLKTMIGMDYDRGLRMLKELIETGSILSQISVHGVQSVPAVRMAGIAGSCPVDEVGAYMETAFRQASEQFSRHGLVQGTMISVYTRFQMKKGIFDTICGHIIGDDVQLPSGSSLVEWSAPAGQAFRVDHIGSYRHLGNGWSVANQLVRHKKLKQQRTGTYEIYRTTPPETAEEELLTEIYLPLKS